MKISGITSFGAGADLTNTAKGAQRPIHNNNNNTLSQNRRFDTFTMVGAGEKDSKLEERPVREAAASVKTYK
ncbi:MAG: hypothetical protein K2J79_05745, partial [Ruminiclostridium sp.]|nr:hypothetical protein [Ruminiclostridium sp.]